MRTAPPRRVQGGLDQVGDPGLPGPGRTADDDRPVLAHDTLRGQGQDFPFQHLAVLLSVATRTSVGLPRICQLRSLTAMGLHGRSAAAPAGPTTQGSTRSSGTAPAAALVRAVGDGVVRWTDRHALVDHGP